MKIFYNINRGTFMCSLKCFCSWVYKFIVILSIMFVASIFIAVSQQSVNNGSIKLQNVDQHYINPNQLKPVDVNKIDNSLKWLYPAQKNLMSYQDVKNSFDKYWQIYKNGKGSGWKPYKRTELFWRNRVDENGNIPNAIDIYDQWQTMQKKNPKKNTTQADNTWKFLGPSSPPQSTSYLDPTGLGRVNCITFAPNNPNIIWIGSAFGGIWKSTNGGGEWKTFPFTQFLSIGISDIAVAQTSSTLSNIVYAATGDADAAFGGINCFSIGIIKTNDGGENWTITNFARQISDRVLINRLIVDPRDTNHVFAATSQGLFVTEDGGYVWDTLTNAYTRDLEFKPGDPNKLLATFIYGNGQQTFYGLYNVAIFPKDGKDSVAFYNTPLVYNYGDVIRMAVSVNENASEYIYVASVKAGGGLHSLVYTANGQDWFYMAQTIDNKIGNYTTDLLNARCDEPDSINSASQGFYDLCLAANPANPMEVYLGGVNVVKYVGGAQPWQLFGFWTTKYVTEGVSYIHADHHDLKFSKDGILFSANDGGIFKYNTKSKEWVDQSNGLEITQFYRIHSARTDPGLIIAGSQDNGTSLLRNKNWIYQRGGDGMDCGIDPFDASIVYNSIYYGDFNVSRDGGNTYSHLVDTTKVAEGADWVTPFAIDPVIPDFIYVGYENLWKANRKGQDPFQKISNFTDKEKITHISISKTDHNVIYVIKPQGVWLTTDGGKAWKQIVPGTGNLALSSITIDPKDPLHFWVTRGSFVEGEKVFEYKKGLFKYSEGIPNVPVNCIVHNKNSTSNQLFIGTDIGVFFRDETMQQWEIYGNGLPNVVVQDLDLNEPSGLLRAATFGRGLWEVKIVDCIIDPPNITLDGKLKLCDGDTLTMTVEGDYSSYRWSNGDSLKSIKVTETGLYSCTVKDNLGCVATSDGITVTKITPPNVTIKNVTGSGTFCEGDSIRLDAGPTINYETFEWSNGTIGRSTYIYSSGTFTATGITRDGCRKVSDSYVTYMNPIPAKPVIEVFGIDLVCSEAASYEWLLDNKTVFGASGKNFSAKKTGYYTVRITDEKGCKNISDPVYVEVVSVDDKIIVSKNISIHPNPAKDLFELEINDLKGENLNIEITNLLGSSVSKINFTKFSGNFKRKIDITNIPAGVYFVNILINNEKFVTKIIKQ